MIIKNTAVNLKTKAKIKKAPQSVSCKQFAHCKLYRKLTTSLILNPALYAVNKIALCLRLGIAANMRFNSVSFKTFGNCTGLLGRGISKKNFSLFNTCSNKTSVHSCDYVSYFLSGLSLHT